MVPLDQWLSRSRRYFLFWDKNEPRNLKRDHEQQFTEDYWAGRRNPASLIKRCCLSLLRRPPLKWVLAIAYKLIVQTEKLSGDRIGILVGVILSLLTSFMLGGLILGLVIGTEKGLTHLVSSVVPTTDPIPPLGTFPTLAVQISASLLGFYLASVGIVLGTAYHNVSLGVRQLVLGNPERRMYLGLIGMAIGAGLILILLSSVGMPYGYLTIGVYAFIVSIGGISFVKLAAGVFDLFSPTLLGEEPLRVLGRAINEIELKRLRAKSSELLAHARKVDRSLRVLKELIAVTRERSSADRESLAILVERLLLRIQLYATKKYLLKPDSPWFLPEYIYPKWIESSHHSVALALQTSTSLQAELSPARDWLERRTAEIVAEALDICVISDNRDASLRITRASSTVVRTLADNYHIEEAISFSQIVRDKCWSMSGDNAAGIAVMAEPPLFMIDLLLGWGQAIAQWRDEVCNVVATTTWSDRNTTSVAIRGTTRLRVATHRTLREIQAEIDVYGKRVTPDWHLRSVLAGEAILSLREIASRLPGLINEYFVSARPTDSPVVQTCIAVGAMQALAKAEFMNEALGSAMNALQGLLLEEDSKAYAEVKEFDGKMRSYRDPVLERLAEATPKLQPESSKLEPDLFGQGFYMLVHHTALDIRSGNLSSLKTIFPKLLISALIFDGYSRSKYLPPHYQLGATMFDPLIDVLELSGLAMIYEVLRADDSATIVKNTWAGILERTGEPQSKAATILDLLDLSEDSFTFGIGTSVGSLRRTEWKTALAQDIVKAGFAAPEYMPFGNQREWTAPPLIKALRVSAHLPRLASSPSVVFGAETLELLSGESPEKLARRRSLHRYHEALKRHTPLGGTTSSSSAGEEDTTQ